MGKNWAQARDILARDGVGVFTFVCDVTDRAQIAEMVHTVTDYYGRIDILVNNAGIIEVGPVQNMARADFEDALAVDFWGVLDMILAVLPGMKAQGAGRIVNIASIGGKVAFPHLLPYAVAKFATTGLSEGLRSELQRDGIIVTTIVPGLLRTGSYFHALFKGKHSEEFAWFGLGRQPARRLPERRTGGPADCSGDAPGRRRADFVPACGNSGPYTGAGSKFHSGPADTHQQRRPAAPLRCASVRPHNDRGRRRLRCPHSPAV